MKIAEKFWNKLEEKTGLGFAGNILLVGFSILSVIITLYLTFIK